MNNNLIFYILKRGGDKPSNFDHAVPLNPSALSPQRLLCSGKTIKRIEIIFPIRLNTPIPVAYVLNSTRGVEKEIAFAADFTNPSRAIFMADANIELNGKYLDFQISRDCAIAFHLQD